MIYPKSILIADIFQPRNGCDADEIRRHDLLYRGGSEFREHLDDFLIRRMVEDASFSVNKSAGVMLGSAATRLYANRKKWAHYANRAGGLIDWFIAQVIPDNASISVSGGKSEFWNSLNENADGYGAPLASILRTALLAVMVNRRAYFSAYFPSAQGDFSDPDTLRVFLRVLNARQVDDWEFLSNSELLEWVRICSVEQKRADAFSRPDQEVRRWKYITATEVATYEAVEKSSLPFSLPTISQNNKEAFLVNIQPHGFGALPIFDIRANENLHVMGRLEDVAVALFNAEAALQYALTLQAYAQPVFHLEDARFRDLVASESNAFVLRETEKYEYVVPPSTAFEMLFKNIDRLKSAFYEVLQSMAINAAAIPQAGRLSSVAVQSMREPMSILLASFRWPIRDALIRWIRAVQSYRREENLKIELNMENEPNVDLNEIAEKIGIKPPSRGAGETDKGDDENGTTEKE